MLTGEPPFPAPSLRRRASDRPGRRLLAERGSTALAAGARPDRREGARQEPEDRYESAATLAAELRAWRACSTSAARPPIGTPAWSSCGRSGLGRPVDCRRRGRWPWPACSRGAGLRRAAGRGRRSQDFGQLHRERRPRQHFGRRRPVARRRSMRCRRATRNPTVGIGRQRRVALIAATVPSGSVRGLFRSKMTSEGASFRISASAAA